MNAAATGSDGPRGSGIAHDYRSTILCMAQVFTVGQRVRFNGKVGVIREVYQGGAYVFFRETSELISAPLEALELAA